MSQLPLEVLYHDLSNLVLGDYLGSGVNRDTYRCRLNPDWVVKVSNREHTWQNINEWEVFWYASKALAKWLAPCRFISPTGRFLIQDYVEPVRVEELPRSVPRWMVDQKQENYGMLNGRLVARDYGTMVSLVSLVKGRRKANWSPEAGYDGSTIKS